MKYPSCIKELLRERLRYGDDYHHSVFMENFEQAKMFESEIIRIDTLLKILFTPSYEIHSTQAKV